MRELEFRRLIEKYQKGLLSGREKKLLDEWFEALGQDTGRAAWSDADKINLRDRIFREIAQTGKAFDFEPRAKLLSGKGVWMTSTFRVAASVVLLAMFLYVAWHSWETEEPKKNVMLQASSDGDVRRVVLADGSIVWLKGTSSIVYPEEFASGNRHVALYGEALFEVARDTSRPFIIQCGELVTTVLGTSFNIKTSAEKIEVLVLTGKISLTSEHQKNGVIVLPNEKAVYNVGEKQITMVDPMVAKEETKATIAGTGYSMYFQDTRMEEIIKRITGKFNVKIETSDPKIANCMITADFTGRSLEQTLSMIGEALGISYEVQDNTVMLRGAGCD